MSYMFKGCSNLEEINFDKFNTNNVYSMDSMFDDCSSLKEFNLSNFNTSKVKDMCNMFKDCSSLVSLIWINDLIKNAFSNILNK